MLSASNDQLFKLRAPNGFAEVDLRVSGIAEIRYVGLATGEFPGPIQAAIDRWIAQGRDVTLFIDAAELKSYETSFRTKWTEWLRKNKPHLRGVHILFRYRLVGMGINLVNPLIGGLITSWSDRTEFEAALARARAERVSSRPTTRAESADSELSVDTRRSPRDSS